MKDASENKIHFQTVESAFISFQLGENTRFEAGMVMLLMVKVFWDVNDVSFIKCYVPNNMA
jgi:hypothetical protein